MYIQPNTTEKLDQVMNMGKRGMNWALNELGSEYDQTLQETREARSGQDLQVPLVLRRTQGCWHCGEILLWHWEATEEVGRQGTMRYIVISIFNLRDQFSWSRPCALEIKCGSNGLCDLLKTFFFHCAMKKIAHGWAGRWCSSFWCSYMWILASATWGLVLLFFFDWNVRSCLV